MGSDSEVGVQATFELFWSAAVVFRFGENLPALRPQHHIFENHLCKIFLSASLWFAPGRPRSVLSLPRLWSVLLGCEVPDVQPVLAGKGELRAVLFQCGWGKKRLVSVLCVLYMTLCAL